MSSELAVTEFSIVVPTHRRPPALRRCLEALSSLEYPRDAFEVIVVDDAGDPRVSAVVASFDGRLDARLVSQAPTGPAGARNAGARVARRDLLAFTDDDCAPTVGWLRALATQLVRRADALVGGPAVNAVPENPFSSASHLLLDYLHGYYNRDGQRARFLASSSMAVGAEAFRELGGFDPRMPLAGGEDRDLCERWAAAGRPLVYTPEAVVEHHQALTAQSFCRQHFRYGQGASYLCSLRAERGSSGPRLEPLSFYGNMLRRALDGNGAHPPPARRAALAGLVVAFQSDLREWLSLEERAPMSEPRGGERGRPPVSPACPQGRGRSRATRPAGGRARARRSASSRAEGFAGSGKAAPQRSGGRDPVPLRPPPRSATAFTGTTRTPIPRLSDLPLLSLELDRPMPTP